MFTLSLPLLLFLHLFSRDARRLWLGALLALAAVFTWALTYWVDRNLQGVTPALIAITAAILVRAWEVGWHARAGVAALVLVQIGWGGNIYFQGADRDQRRRQPPRQHDPGAHPRDAGEVPS